MALEPAKAPPGLFDRWRNHPAPQLRSLAWPAEARPGIGRMTPDKSVSSFAGLPVPGKRTFANFLLNLTGQALVPTADPSKFQNSYVPPDRALKSSPFYANAMHRAPAAQMVAQMNEPGLLSDIPAAAGYAPALRQAVNDPFVLQGLNGNPGFQQALRML